jgi:hypothetical protein
MTRITGFSPKLTQFISTACEDLGKEIVVKSCKGLGGALAYATSYKTDILNELPVYVGTHSSLITKKGVLTELGEGVVAHEIEHYVVNNDGYKEPMVQEMKLFTGGKVIPQKAVKFLMVIQPKMPNTILNFLSHVRINNILSRAGFNISKENDLVAKRIMKDLPENLQTPWSANLMGLGVDTRERPDITRALVIHDVLVLTELYMFTPDDKKEDFLNKIGVFWKGQVLAFIEQSMFNKTYPELISISFAAGYSPTEYVLAEENIHSYVKGKDDLYDYTPRSREDNQKALVTLADAMIQRGDLLNAFDVLDQITLFDENIKQDKVMTALIEYARKKGGAVGTKEQVKFICRMFISMEMQPVALSFYERMFGIHSNIDLT